jgi:hypothetical protein
MVHGNYEGSFVVAEDSSQPFFFTRLHAFHLLNERTHSCFSLKCALLDHRLWLYPFKPFVKLMAARAINKNDSHIYGIHDIAFAPDEKDLPLSISTVMHRT